MALPEISVIVPVRNGRDSLPALLRSLEDQSLEPGRFEVVVVDNASSDETTAIAREYRTTVVHEPIPNRSRARNRGVTAATSPLYAFTDADCVADRRWVEELLAHSHLGPLVAGDVKLRVSPKRNRIERFEELWRFGQEAWVKQGWAATANLLVRAEAFEAVGGFDPSWRHIAEDVDFCFRARAAGYELTYCGAAVVEHQGEKDLFPWLRRCFLHGYSANQAFYRLGAGARAWRSPLPALIGDSALRAIGLSPGDLPKEEWTRMIRMARLAYAARVAGSIWSEVRHAR